MVWWRNKQQTPFLNTNSDIFYLRTDKQFSFMVDAQTEGQTNRKFVHTKICTNTIYLYKGI